MINFQSGKRIKKVPLKITSANEKEIDKIIKEGHEKLVEFLGDEKSVDGHLEGVKKKLRNDLF